jgi:hypothetical protein
MAYRRKQVTKGRRSNKNIQKNIKSKEAKEKKTKQKTRSNDKEYHERNQDINK